MNGDSFPNRDDEVGRRRGGRPARIRLDIDTLRAEYESGNSLREIARRHQIDHTSVWRLLHGLQQR